MNLRECWPLFSAVVLLWRHLSSARPHFVQLPRFQSLMLSPSVDIECIYFTVSHFQLCSAKCDSCRYGGGPRTRPKHRGGGEQLQADFYEDSRQKWWIEAECFCQAQTRLTCPPQPFSRPCYLSTSTRGLLSCIVMFYSASEEYWKIKRAATRANNPSWSSSVFHRGPPPPPLLPCGPSNRAHLDLSMMMTEGCRFDIHYSAVGAGRLSLSPHGVLCRFAESAAVDAKGGQDWKT